MRTFANRVGLRNDDERLPERARANTEGLRPQTARERSQVVAREAKPIARVAVCHEAVEICRPYDGNIDLRFGPNENYRGEEIVHLALAKWGS